MPTQKKKSLVEPAEELAAEAPSGLSSVAKKLRVKKAAEGAAAAEPLAAVSKRKSVSLEAGLKKAKPTDPAELYKEHAFERLMMSLVWPQKLSPLLDPHHRYGREPTPRPDFEGDLSGWVGAGREESLSMGATTEALERLEADSELCEAIGKIALLGCKDLKAFGDDEKRETGARGHYGSQPALNSGVTIATVISGLFEALKAESTRSSGLREAVIALAGDEKEWAGAPLSGLMEASEEELKSPKRGGLARAAMTRMVTWERVSQNSPTALHRKAMSKRAWGVREDSGGLREAGELKAYLREVEGYEAALPVFFAESLKVAARDPKLLPAFEKMCSERCGFGFEGVGQEDTAETILPELGELTRLKRSTSPNEQKKRHQELERGLAGEGAAGVLALAAAKAYGFDAPTPQALVGEAKRALQEQSGLSAASWKMALSSPAALAALVAGLEKTERFARNANALLDRRETLKNNRAQESKKRSEQGELLVEARFDAAGRKAAESLGASVSARALSLGLAQGIAPESIERVLRAAWTLSETYGRSSKFLVNLLAGRAPMEGFFEMGSPGAMRLRLADIEAVGAQGPTWVKILCEQLDKRVKKGLAASGFKSEQEAALALEERVEPQEGEREAREPIFRDASGAQKKKKKMSALERIELNSAWSIQGEVELLNDYISAMGGGFFSNLPEKFGWGTLMRQQELWHEDQTRRRYESDPSAGRVWEPALGAFGVGEFKAVELVTGRQLIEEGEKMRHCVASYTSRCLEGSSRIFSISRHGARVATLELAPMAANGASALFAEGQNGKGVASWRVNQNKGRHNAAVTDAGTLDFCALVERRANEALAELKQKAAAKPEKKGPGLAG